MKPLTWAFIAALALPGTSCFRERQESVQVDAAAQLWFTGNLEDCQVTVTQDGKTLWSATDVSADQRYSLKPGTYRVMVTRNGALCVDRKVFIADGDTTEIRVP